MSDHEPLIRGTLSVLILKALSEGPLHGYGISKWILAHSSDVLRAEEGVLYPVLHKLAKEGVLAAQWGSTETGRRARFYRLTARGEERLEAETQSWLRASRAVNRALDLGTS